MDDAHILDVDGSLDQTVPNLNSPSRNSPNSSSNSSHLVLDGRMERYSRKVFVGGLPPDIDEGKEADIISHLGSLALIFTL